MEYEQTDDIEKDIKFILFLDFIENLVSSHLMLILKLTRSTNNDNFVKGSFHKLSTTV